MIKLEGFPEGTDELGIYEWTTDCEVKKKAMFKLSFNEFHNVEAKDMPQHGEFCFLALKDGRHTAGAWYPNDDQDRETVSGEFIRGTADAVDVSEVSKWYSLKRYDLTGCLEDEEIDYIDLGPESEAIHTVKIKDFKSFTDGDLPKHKQYCLLILNSGGLAAGRWKQWLGKNEGSFAYASAGASHGMDKVWAWTALSTDSIYAAEEEKEIKRKLEEELNRNPSADPEKFKYGTDISVYYEKALEKLRRDYPWATVTQMKKKTPYVIVPRNGQFIFGQDNGMFKGSRVINEWTEGATADEFIDFLCDYTREAAQNSDPEVKFKYGLDIDVYLKKAYENVKKDYSWLDQSIIDRSWQYAIMQVEGDWEFVRRPDETRDFTVFDVSSADSFIKSVESGYQDAALKANPAVAEYSVPIGRVEIHGWYLEKYIFSKLRTGDYKVTVQAGNRTTGGSRDFFITPYCFEAETYEEFLDRYLEIVPGGSFGMFKEDLLASTELKEFLGY